MGLDLANKRMKVIFYLVVTLYWFSMYTYVPILSPYVEHLGGSLFMVGLVIGSYGLTQMLLRIPLGIWSDRLGRRKVFILAGITCAAVSSVGLALSPNVWLVLLFRSLAGCAAASWVLFTVLFASYFRDHETAKSMGIISFYNSMGQLLATTSGGFLVEYLGWAAPFYVGAAGGLIGLFFAVQIKENPLPAKRETIKIKNLLQVGENRLLLGVSALAVLVQSVVFTTMFGFIPLHAVAIGVSKADISILMLLTMLPNAVAGYISGSVIVHRLGERRKIITGFVVVTLCTISIPFTHHFVSLVATQMLNGFGQGLLMPILMSLSIRSIPAEQRATAMGFFQSIYSLGMFGGPFIAGWIGKWTGLNGGFLFAGFISLIGSILSWWCIPNRVKDRKVLSK
ncbi:MFS transporter [Aneurinibacillus sp. Ricciae_BoGa-3]|uniref:MFS transporter n=1 Tax=Aneurinibacillus sp. Ricciae_BoGa-3 TaxID=3022697 RepID=UPI0023410C9B|nr:MFS transporter [Aneurinibacillus sp. Ricciae_BoGa-3]WCK56432.1 MFS transporter [Aneurinibacillus sp. Ricciae_BoGa-3]